MTARGWLVSIVFLVLGLAAGARLTTLRQPPAPRSDDYRQRYDVLAARIHELEDGDLKDYVRLKKSEDRYKKADEILGKVLLAILVDAGIHLRPELAAQLREPHAPDTARPVEKPYQTPASRPWQGDVARPGDSRPVPPPSAPPASTPRTWAKNENLLANVSSDDQVRGFLDQVVIPDLYSELRTVKPLDAGRLAQINGSFTGEIVFDDKTKPLWQLDLTVAGAMDEDKAQGTLNMKVWENGRTSQNSQTGVFRGYSSFGDDSAAILAEIQKDMGFMQLYTLPQSDKLIGNYYAKSGTAGSFKRTGTVLLHRR